MDQMDSIISDYADAGRQFTCYHNDDNTKVIIKTVDLMAVIHSWVWPTLAFILGIAFALLAYHEKIGQPAPHDDDDDNELDRQTIVQEIREEKVGVANKVAAIEELESELDGELSTRTQNALAGDKVQLAPSDDELCSNA